jgi:hypothetical protein
MPATKHPPCVVDGSSSYERKDLKETYLNLNSLLWHQPNTGL